ncbi:hypothetical protein ACQPV1_20755 [Clostridium neonatale]|uniref:hypothetical protein n=1 Tax=Clostridium neonatale TaxID=137838 RepID=UPI003D33E2B6
MNIIFGYKTGPSCGFFDKDDGGFSVEVLSNGIIEYKTYLFDNKVKSKENYKINDKNLNKIKNILDTYSDEINSIPTNLDNGSCDGDINLFIFNDKEIIAWNIKYSDIKKVQKKNPDYYEEYHKNIKYENIVIDVFNDIVKVLKIVGIKLDLNSIKLMNKIKVSD